MSAPSPFEIITPGNTKKQGSKGIIVALVVVLFLVASIFIGITLVRQNQDVREQASTSNRCPSAEKCPYPGDPNRLWSCHPKEADGTVTESLCDRKGRVETCGVNLTKYCCPAVGGNWTTNMTACAVVATPSPTPAPTKSPSPAPTQVGQVQCNASCTSSSQCSSGNICYIASGATGFCRKSACVSSSNCVCPSTTGSPSPTPTKSPSPVPGSTKSPSPTPGVQTTPLPIPETGTSLPTILGGLFGVLVIVGSLILAF